MSTYRDDRRAQREAEAAGAVKARLLARVRLATPCTARWDSMEGNDRVRYCHQCEKNVHNLSAMTLTEAENFLGAHAGGDACIRFFRRRADGRILTADCPEGVEARAKKVRRLTVLGGAATVVSLALGAVNELGNGSNGASDEHVGVTVPIDAPTPDPVATQAVYK